jgi:hypothetical protein
MLWILTLAATLLVGVLTPASLVKSGRTIAPQDVRNGGPTTAAHGSALTPDDVVNGGPTT